jgi:hypothetical protein
MSEPTFRSRFISPSQYRGLQRLGDGMCPGDDDFPSFSACGCAEHVDDILELMNPADLAQLEQLLTAASRMPGGAIQALLKLAERSPHMSDRNPLAPTLRFLRLGLRGLVISLYYSGRTGAGYDANSPLDVIGYDVGVYTGDLD